MINYMELCNREILDCETCSKDNKFPYDECCLFECGNHEFCRGCYMITDHSSTNDDENIFNIKSLTINENDIVIVKARTHQSQFILHNHAESIINMFPKNKVLFLTGDMDIETISIDILKKLIENKETNNNA